MRFEPANERTSVAASKRPYHAPELKRLGRVSELTLNGGSVNIGDGPNPNFKSNP
ncbi:MAG TPA: lasso RiPP family leader peptide-containing protein [Polyangiaceae bacterium]|nr:lasso RiPP family leader peptide-containing protein [Polyangiaceae bacterium]